MAATVQAAVGVSGQPYLVTKVRVSTIDAGVPLDVAHGGPSGVKPNLVLMEVVTRADSRDVISLAHEVADDNTTNNTARVIPDTVAGGNLTGAVLDLYFVFFAQATGGIT